MNRLVCPECAEENKQSSRSCEKCGASLVGVGVKLDKMRKARQETDGEHSMRYAYEFDNPTPLAE